MCNKCFYSAMAPSALSISAQRRDYLILRQFGHRLAGFKQQRFSPSARDAEIGFARPRRGRLPHSL